MRPSGPLADAPVWVSIMSVVSPPARLWFTTLCSAVDKAQAGKLCVLPGQRGVGEFRCSGWPRNAWHLVACRLELVFVRQLLWLAAKVLQQFTNEGAGTGGRVQNVHITVDQVFAKVLFTQPICPVDHETHDFIGRVDHAQTVGGLGVVDLVKLLVNDLHERSGFSLWLYVRRRRELAA